MRARSTIFALLSIAACGGSSSDTSMSASGAGGASSGAGGGATSTSSKASGATSSSSAGGGSGGSGPATPTVSSWLGTNADVDLSRVDITYVLAPFDTPAAQKDANGYPVAGASGKSATDVGFLLPSGTYKIQYKGTGMVSVSGIGALGGAWTTANGEQRDTLTITGTPGSFGNFLTIDITNGASDTVTDLRILSPGFDYDTTQIFLPQFLNLLAPFRAMRFMGWLATNGSTLANWSDRPTGTSFGSSKYGEPIEHVVELANATGKDIWVNVPEQATDDYVHQMAKLFATTLDFKGIDALRKKQGFTTPFELIVEYSNETWNMGFSSYGTLLATANANPARYTGMYSGSYGPSWMSGDSDLMKVGQVEGDRLAQIGAIFRQELDAAGQQDAVKPVLSGWALGAVYSDVALQFIKDNYGDPKTIVGYVALAPYFNADDSMTDSLTDLFPALTANIDSMEPVFGDFAMLSQQWGIPIAAYEGGQSLTGTTNQNIKHLAQHDERMYEAYNHYADVWKKHFGESLFMHFDLAGTPGLPENIYQYGYWGSIISSFEDPKSCAPSLPTLMGTEDVATVVHHCPKYRALMEHVPE